MNKLKDISKKFATTAELYSWLNEKNATGQLANGTAIYAQAAGLGMTVPQMFEVMCPGTNGMTAFEAIFKEMGIFTKSEPAKGLWASPAAFFVPTDNPASGILFPAFVQQKAMIARLNATASIESLVASTRQITGSTYQGLAIDISGLSQGKGFRVSESGEFPKVKFSWSEHANAIKKHGVRIDMSYEFLRRASIETVGLLVSKIAEYDSINAFNDAILYLLNGNTANATLEPAAVSVTARSLDSANDSAGKISYKAWLKWLSSFGVHKPNLVIGDIDAIIAAILMTRPAADTLALINAMKAGTVDATAVINRGNELFPNIRFEVVPTATIGANTLLGIDTTACVERVIEVGSDLTETQKFITNQTETMVMSLADNLSLIWPEARKVLSLVNGA